MKKTLLALLGVTILTGCGAPDDEALFKAIHAKDTEQVARILDKGNVTLDPPQQPNQVNKPLAYAAAYGNLDIVKLILARGASIDGQVAYGDVALIKAAEHGNRDIITYLLEQGADVNRPNAFGISPFIGFCAAEDVELVQLAIKHGGKVNESYVLQTGQGRGKKNYTALQAAVAHGKTDVVKLLLANGGDPNIKDQSGKTCLELAQEKKHPEIANMLK
jgi:ankyrin repeat protein